MVQRIKYRRHQTGAQIWDVRAMITSVGVESHDKTEDTTDNTDRTGPRYGVTWGAKEELGVHDSNKASQQATYRLGAKATIEERPTARIGDPSQCQAKHLVATRAQKSRLRAA